MDDVEDHLAAATLLTEEAVKLHTSGSPLSIEANLQTSVLRLTCPVEESNQSVASVHSSPDAFDLDCSLPSLVDDVSVATQSVSDLESVSDLPTEEYSAIPTQRRRLATLNLALFKLSERPSDTLDE